MNTLHDEVRSWLDSLFPNRDVPSFEVNEANLQALSDLARYSKERERDIGNINKVGRHSEESNFKGFTSHIRVLAGAPEADGRVPGGGG